MTRPREPAFRTLVAVDWSKAPAKRSAWAASVAARTLLPLPGSHGTLGTLLATARTLPAPVLVGIDAALGVPRAYLEAARRAVPAWTSATDFLAWLPLALETPGFLDTQAVPEDWSPARPFVSVPPGEGALRRIWARAGGPLLRAVDAATGAKSPFVVAGIPGTVGSGTRALWSELASLLGTDAAPAVWPFEGPLARLGATAPLVLAELYPRVCYAIALEDVVPARLLRIAKVQPAARARALDALVRARWFREARVKLARRDLARARASEDDFDALLSAAALLRATLERRPLDRPHASPVEGDILALGLLDLA